MKVIRRNKINKINDKQKITISYIIFYFSCILMKVNLKKINE